MTKLASQMIHGLTDVYAVEERHPMAALILTTAKVLLTYCSNVHPGETLASICRNLDRVAVPIKSGLFSDRPMGLGLWLPASAIRELQDLDNRAAFRNFLAQRELFVFTLNAFPFGGFHSRRVKQHVFEPSWADRRRLDYTLQCAEVLADLLPEGLTGSISSVPLGHSAAGYGRDQQSLAVRNLRELGELLQQLYRRTGASLVLGLEPEPTAALETIREGVEFLNEAVFQGAQDPLRERLGLCLDACHESVMHQDLLRSLEVVREGGVRLAKIQITSALELPRPGQNLVLLDRLRGFDEGRYFHQVVVRDGSGELTVYPDLEPFFAASKAGELPADLVSLRTHFHVPVYAGSLDGLETTRPELEQFLVQAVASGLTDHFEVETYTFGVIPDRERTGLGAHDLGAALIRELQWSRESLGR